MNDLEGTRTKYFSFLAFSIVAAIVIFVFGSSMIPLRYTQILMLKDPAFSQGMQENIIALEEQIKAGSLNLVDNVAHPITTASYRASVIKMVSEQKGIPTTKYRLEVRFNYPHSDIPRYTKLDAILVDLKGEQNREFVDLFWNLE